MEYVTEVIKTVNENPTPSPMINVEYEKTATKIYRDRDNPTSEPTICQLTTDDNNIDNLSSDLHIHDRLIDKTNNSISTFEHAQQLNVCLPCHISKEQSKTITTSMNIQYLKICSAFEDHVYTQPFRLQPPPPAHAYRMLMDLGANRSATCHKELLENYKPIPKKKISGANKDTGDVTVEGIGYLPWYTPWDQKLLIKTYYSPDLAETIVSPTDVALTQNKKYQGFTIKVNVIKGTGTIKFINLDGICHATYPIQLFNGLWYSLDRRTPQKSARSQQNKRINAIINRLTIAAEYELWHQRLGHPGESTMKGIHNLVKGIPKLKGNAFHRCLSCMLSKMAKSTTHKHEDYFDLEEITKMQQLLNSKDPNKEIKQWTRTDKDATTFQITSEDGPAWSSVIRRITTDLTTNETIEDIQITPTTPEFLLRRQLLTPIDNLQTTFHYLDTKKSTDVDPLHNIKKGDVLHIDFGFMRGEFSDKDQNGRIVTSIDGFNSYAIIVDKATRWMWILLTKSKVPPIDFTRKILQSFGPRSYQGRITTDQGGELARSEDFRKMIAEEDYILQPTAAYTPEQNGLAERPNRTLGQMTRCLLHSAGLGDEFWSYAILHAVYLKN